MNSTDTLVWLVNFPATHAQEMAFVGGFSILGILALALRSKPRRSRLEELRAERGQAPAMAPLNARIGTALQAWIFRLLALVVGAGLVIAIASMIFGPITRGYIYENGNAATVTKNDYLSNTITFTAEDGKTYTMSLAFFSPPTYPDRNVDVIGNERLVVRYLPDHPQAFVIDTAESVDSSGDPLGT